MKKQELSQTQIHQCKFGEWGWRMINGKNEWVKLRTAEEVKKSLNLIS